MITVTASAITTSSASSYNAERIAAEIEPAQDVFASVLGAAPGVLPFARVNHRHVDPAGYSHATTMANVFTSDDLQDWVSPRISSSQLVANVERTLHPGYILLIHDGGNHQPTINAMPMIIDTIRVAATRSSRSTKCSRSPHWNWSRGSCRRCATRWRPTSPQRMSSATNTSTSSPSTTYLELNTNLSPERRELIEAKIAEAVRPEPTPLRRRASRAPRNPLPPAQSTTAATRACSPRRTCSTLGCSAGVPSPNRSTASSPRDRSSPIGGCSDGCCANHSIHPAVITAVIWVLLGDSGEAVTRVVTMLVISCALERAGHLPPWIGTSTALRR